MCPTYRLLGVLQLMRLSASCGRSHPLREYRLVIAPAELTIFPSLANCISAYEKREVNSASHQHGAATIRTWQAERPADIDKNSSGTEPPASSPRSQCSPATAAARSPSSVHDPRSGRRDHQGRPGGRQDHHRERKFRPAPLGLAVRFEIHRKRELARRTMSRSVRIWTASTGQVTVKVTWADVAASPAGRNHAGQVL